MPLFEVEGRVERRGRVVVEATDVEDAKEAFRAHFTGGIADGLHYAEEDSATVEVTDAGETDGVYIYAKGN